MSIDKIVIDYKGIIVDLFAEYFVKDICAIYPTNYKVRMRGFRYSIKLELPENKYMKNEQASSFIFAKDIKTPTSSKGETKAKPPTPICPEGKEQSRNPQCEKLIELHQTLGITSFTCDDQGNIIEEKGPKGTTTYEYSPLNQQTKVITHQGHIQVNRYDTEGLRAEIEENERLTKFIFHKENILAETDQEDNVIARLIRGYEVVASDLCINVNEINRYYYSQDEQGSALYITDENQTIQNAYTYDAFGNILTKQENIHNRITYTGQQYDAITQQYYLRARYYNPIIGRFTQEDVYRGDGLNLYVYCANNPVNYYDPSGYDKCKSKKQQMASVENDSNKDLGGRSSDINGQSSTKIDSSVTSIEKVDLPVWLKDTYTDGDYRTVITNEEITVYRTFGGRADAGGGFATTSSASNRISAKMETALLPEWGNTRRYEAEIKIPKGEILNIGKVAEQKIKSTGTVLPGGADQILLPQNWPLEWISQIKVVPN